MTLLNNRFLQHDVRHCLLRFGKPQNLCHLLYIQKLRGQHPFFLQVIDQRTAYTVNIAHSRQQTEILLQFRHAAPGVENHRLSDQTGPLNRLTALPPDLLARIQQRSIHIKCNHLVHCCALLILS